MRKWLHNLRHVDCAVCGSEFRKGKGSGASGRVVCSEACYQQAWVDFFRGGAA